MRLLVRSAHKYELAVHDVILHPRAALKRNGDLTPTDNRSSQASR